MTDQQPPETTLRDYIASLEAQIAALHKQRTIYKRMLRVHENAAAKTEAERRYEQFGKAPITPADEKCAITQPAFNGILAK